MKNLIVFGVIGYLLWKAFGVKADEYEIEEAVDESHRIIGGSPASAGYEWNYELHGWWRSWEGSSSLVPREQAAHWDTFIPVGG